MSKLRNCCFTINNPKDEEKIKEFLGGCKYAVFGREVGESGTKHLQGYAEWSNSKSFKVVHKGLENGHLEVRRGSRYDAAMYCVKECGDDFWEIGERPSEDMYMGKRTDLDRLRDCVSEGDNSVRSMISSGGGS